jgi:hypothetical protein
LGWLLMQAGLLCRSFFPSPLLSSTVSTTCIEVWGSSRELPLGVSCSRFLDGRCWHGPSLRGAAGRHQRPRPWSSWSRHIKASVPVRGCALVMVATAHHLVLCCYFGRNATPLSWVPNLEVALCFYSSSPMAAQQLPPPPHTHTHHHHHHFYDQSRIFGRWEGQWLWSLDTGGCAVRLSRLMHEVLHLCSTLVFGAYCRATKVSRSACEEVLHFHTVCPSDHLCLALLQFCLC